MVAATGVAAGGASSMGAESDGRRLLGEARWLLRPVDVPRGAVRPAGLRPLDAAHPGYQPPLTDEERAGVRPGPRVSLSITILPDLWVTTIWPDGPDVRQHHDESRPRTPHNSLSCDLCLAPLIALRF